jgi:LPXTG-motif cell wall-anchored protein
MSVGVIRLANTITVTTTTIPANQLPATGRDENGLLISVALFGIGILLLGMRRRALR